MISRPITEVRKIARVERAGWRITAYRPGILRQFPCILSLDGARVFCPLLEFILERVTAGVFYEYALQYIQA